MTRMNSRRPMYAALAALTLAWPAAAQADAVGDFYKGKTVSIIIGTSPGNDYDFRGRLIGRYLGEHLPGQPSVVPRNMPGAGSLLVLNYIANSAPKGCP